MLIKKATEIKKDDICVIDFIPESNEELDLITTDFTAIGAEKNEINHKFTATGPGSGDGKVKIFNKPKLSKMDKKIVTAYLKKYYDMTDDETEAECQNETLAYQKAKNATILTNYLINEKGKSSEDTKKELKENYEVVLKEITD